MRLLWGKGFNTLNNRKSKTVADLMRLCPSFSLLALLDLAVEGMILSGLGAGSHVERHLVWTAGLDSEAGQHKTWPETTCNVP